MTLVKAYIGALVVFLLADGLWLGVVARSFYRDQLGELLADKPNMLAAALFYVAYVAGVVYLAVHPALARDSWTVAALHGAVLGLLAYGTYDMTNLATIQNWPMPLVIVDMLWGTVLTATIASVGFFAARIGT